jgi:hypothetical protein
MVTAAELPAMNKPFKNPKFIFFTDFDGTITLQDSNDYMVGLLGQSYFQRISVDRPFRQTTSGSVVRSVGKATKMCSKAPNHSGASSE